MPVPITALFAGVLTLILMGLGFHVGAYRGKTGISILHGDDMELAVRMRRHQNFLENVPMALILMALLELDGASPFVLYALGSVLVIGRILHPIGLRHDTISHPMRTAGAATTMLVQVVAAVLLLWQVVTA